VGTYRGSLLAVDGQFLCLGELGHLLWLDLTPKGYRQVSRARLFSARESWGLPVLSRGLLYVMQNTRDTFQATGPRLLCYDLRAS
jgi:outer membrane protein assembly factor BamB